MVSKLWKNYDATSAYDGYFTEDNKLRKHATIISGILERHGKKKLLEIEKNKVISRVNKTFFIGFFPNQISEMNQIL